MRTQRGTIAALQQLHQHGTIRQRGAIRGEDGSLYQFRREDMVSYLDYLDLRMGDHVTFEIGTTGRAINVERAVYPEPT